MARGSVKVASHLGMRPPHLSPARGPPQADLLTGLLDQTPAFEPGPDFEFDQSLPDEMLRQFEAQRPMLPNVLHFCSTATFADRAHPRVIRQSLMSLETTG